MRTTFFTSANNAYELFVLPYMTSVLVHNEDARVEVCLDDSAAFTLANAAALDILATGFGSDRFLLRNTAELSNVSDSGMADTTVPPNTVRFIQTPEVITEYTYIGDIDMLLLESVTDKHLRRMAHTGMPYSNILRPGRKALSGLHFTRSDIYYPVRIAPDAALNRDEYLLYDLVVARGLGLPDPDDRWRPMHGYHMSLRRGPLSALGWGLSESKPCVWRPARWSKALHRMRTGKSIFGAKRRFDAYCRLQENEIWKAVLPFFDSRYVLLLGMLDVALTRLLLDGRIRGSFAAQHARHLLLEPDLVGLIASKAK